MSQRRRVVGWSQLMEMYERELQRLQDEVLILGGMVEKLIVDALDVLERRDLGGVRQLTVDHRRIASKRFVVEMGCLNLVGDQWPSGGDLSRIVAMLEIANELECIGGHAAKIVSPNCVTMEQSLLRQLTSVHRLATTVLNALHRALEAFGGWDAALAQAAVVAGQELDALHGQVYQETLALIGGSRDLFSQATCFLRTAYSLRRVADRAAGICEWIVFAGTGLMAELPFHPPQKGLEVSAGHQPMIAL